MYKYFKKSFNSDIMKIKKIWTVDSIRHTICKKYFETVTIKIIHKTWV